MRYNDLIINAIEEIEGYFLRKAYSRQEYALEMCDAIIDVAHRSITEIENTSGDVPRCKRFFFLESVDGKTVTCVDTPHLEEFWRQVRQEVERQRALK